MRVLLVFIALLGLIATVFAWRRFGTKAAMGVAIIFIAWGGIAEIVYTAVTWIGHDRFARRGTAIERRAAHAEAQNRRHFEAIDPGTDQPNSVLPDLPDSGQR